MVSSLLILHVSMEIQVLTMLVLCKSSILDQKLYKKSQVTFKNAGKIELVQKSQFLPSK